MRFLSSGVSAISVSTLPLALRRPWSRLDVARAGVAVFLANAALLVLQLVAGRVLAPFIGVALETWTAVIGVFLAGISLGNAFGGRLADRAPNAATLGRLLLAGGASVLACFAVAKVFAYTHILHAVPLYPRIALATFATCFPPAFVLSLITPVAIQIALPDVRRTGRVVGLVYALGTLGSLTGNFVTGFVLIALLNVDAIVSGTAAGLLLLGLLAGIGARRSAAAEFARGYDPDPSSILIEDPRALFRDLGPTATPRAMSPTAACAVVFVASFCSMALELTASRMLAPQVGISLYSWTGIIGVVLAAIACGNTLGGWVADRNPRRAALGNALFLAGLFCLTVLMLYGILANSDGLRYELSLIGRILAWALALFFLPMLLLGTITPQATRLAVSEGRHAGRVAGRIYAWSCAGAILGTFATGWVLIALLGVFKLVLVLSLVLIGLAVAVGRLWEKPAELFGCAMVAGAGIGGLALGGKLTSPYTLETNYYAIQVIDNTFEDEPVKTLVLDRLWHSHVKPDDPSFLGYPHEQVQMEFLRAMAAEADPRLLVIGGGGYTLPRWAEAFEPQVKVAVVEIDPGVTEVAHRELGLSRDTRIVTHNCDGRQFVQEQAKPGAYQLVVQDAVNDLSVPYHIMTREYNDAVKRLLTPDGVYLLTVIDEYNDGELLRAAIRTMRLTFAHVHLMAAGPLWETAARGVFVIYGSDRPLDLAALAKAAGGSPLQTAVQPMELTDAYVAKEPQIILTDAYAPVDNLIGVAFRKRE